MSAPGPFHVVEHRQHPRAALTYSLVDRSGLPGQQHIATFFDETMVEAVAEVLNANDRAFRKALDARVSEQPF